jgi:hypothetical protein
MAKRSYCVQVALFEPQLGPNVDVLIECLRYAGVLSVVSQTDKSTMIRIHCPKGLVSEPWAKMNAERMRTFGYNAEVAPELP